MVFCLRKRRKDEFDGNFDPAHVTSVKGGGGGGTLPNIDLGENGLLGNGNGAGAAVVDEDDGMGGRLGAGAGAGGIIVPYAFKPSIPLAGGSVGGHQHPQMQQMANVGLTAGGVAASAGYGNEKRAMRQAYAQQDQIYSTSGHTRQQSTSLSVSSGSHYPTTLAPSSSHPGYFQNQQLIRNSASPEPNTPGASDGSSSFGGGGVYYNPQSMGRGGPSPGPSVLSSSSGGRNAKEMEAVGRVVVNPEDGVGGSQAFQAYLQNGPQQPSASSSGPILSQRGGASVVVHEDGGRVIPKGAEAEAALSPEIPPTYDSLPLEVRRAT